ncbi:MAG: redoxin domain-containing protein [Deltaproteobacteria bacterium]|nr:redoxin domain-containing protein [Deltaproteobacteria bacterium]
MPSVILAPLLAVGGAAAYMLLALKLGLYWRVPWPFLTVIAAGAGLGVVALVRRPGVGSGISAVLSGGVLVLALWWLFSFSMFGPREDRPRVGDVFPDFALPSAGGGTFALAERSGRRHLLMLYRGDWCPFCQVELERVRARYDDIAARGVDVVAISVDPPATSAALRERLGGRIEFVSDQDGTLLDQLGVRQRDGVPAQLAGDRASRDIFLPTTFLLDEQHRVRWVYRPDTYRVRATPDEILVAIDGLGPRS